jgi:ribosomal protein L1
MASIKSAKPQSVKGTYIKAIHVTTTMGPSITANPNE